MTFCVILVASAPTLLPAPQMNDFIGHDRIPSSLLSVKFEILRKKNAKEGVKKPKKEICINYRSSIIFRRTQSVTQIKSGISPNPIPTSICNLVIRNEMDRTSCVAFYCMWAVSKPMPNSFFGRAISAGFICDRTSSPASFLTLHFQLTPGRRTGPALKSARRGAMISTVTETVAQSKRLCTIASL